MAPKLEDLEKHIPYYLTAEDRQHLTNELRAISSGASVGYVLSSYHEHPENFLQGDGWRGFQLFEFATGAKRSVRGLVLSNSCDIDPSNPRDLPTKITFAPLVKLDVYADLLVRSGVSGEKLAAKIGSIRAQETTNIFFIPAGGALDCDYIVRLDEAQSMPVSALVSHEDKKRLFTLSNTGFYMLIFKLSVHFCRLQEKVHRRNTLVA